MIWNDVLNEACHILGWHNFALSLCMCICFSCILSLYCWFIQIIGKWHEHMYVKLCWSEHVSCFWVMCIGFRVYVPNEWWMIALIIHYHPDLLFDHVCILRWYKWFCVGFLVEFCNFDINKRDGHWWKMLYLIIYYE